MTSDDALRAGLDEMAEATDRLLGTVDGLDERALRAPSALPDWTVGHVLTHVARNADGMVRLVEWARTGVPQEMYDGGRAGRDTEIAAGAARHIGDVRLDLADSAERLLAAFADFPEDGLDREVALLSGARFPGRSIPLMRVREVEVHHVDLGAGYGPDDWSAEFATRTLDQLAPLFRERDCPVGTLTATDGVGRWQVAAEGPELSGPRRALLAWLTGRSDGARLSLSPAGEVPRAPRWS